MIRGHGPWCDPGCFGCKVAAVSVKASAATPNRFGSNGIAPRTSNPAWERGIAGERRGDSFVPYLDLDRNLAPIRVKQAGELRHKLDDQLHRLRNDPNVFRRTPDQTAQGAST